jgi:hypothetical protein
MSEASTSDKFAGLRLPLFGQLGEPLMRNKVSGDLQYMGLPYRGGAQPFKNDDPQYKQPQYHVDIRVRQFETTKPEDMDAYQAAVQRVADGRAFISYEERQYDTAIGGWRILLRWGEPHYDEPKQQPVS